LYRQVPDTNDIGAEPVATPDHVTVTFVTLTLSVANAVTTAEQGFAETPN